MQTPLKFRKIERHVYKETTYAHVKHPVTGKYMPLHRYVMECILGRPLERCEIVHHVDRNGLNNYKDNLALCTHAEHRNLHKVERIIRNHGDPEKHVICTTCHRVKAKSDMISRIGSICKDCRKKMYSIDKAKPKCKKYLKHYAKIRERMESDEYKRYQREYHLKYKETEKFKAAQVRYQAAAKERYKARYKKLKELHGLVKNDYTVKSK